MVKTLDSNYKTGARFSRSESRLIDPTSIDRTKPAFSDNRVRSEVPGREFKFVEGEAFDVRLAQYLSFSPMSC